jgi:type IV secretory pathway VirB6-like protein
MIFSARNNPEIKIFNQFSLSVLFKIILILFSFVFFNSCDPYQHSDEITLEDIQIFDPDDKGVRYPDKVGMYSGNDFDGDGEVSYLYNVKYNPNELDDGHDENNMRWGRKSGGWHHACASEVIKYSLSGDLSSAIPLMVKLNLMFINMAIKVIAPDVDPLAWLKKIFDMSGNFSDYHWDTFNPSCSAIAATKGLTLLALKEGADRVCGGIKPKPKSANKLTKLQKFKKGAKKAAWLGGKAASGLGGIGLKDFKAWYELFYQCKGSIALASAAAATSSMICAGSFGTGCTPAIAYAKKTSKDSILCCSAFAAYSAAFIAALAEIRIKYATATRHQKKVVVCGHDWYGWKLNTIKNNKGEEVKREVKGPYHSNLNAIKFGEDTKGDRYRHTYYSYKGALLEMNAKNNLERNIKNQQYRELIYGGREISDPDPESGGGCMMPKISNDDLVKLYGFGDNDRKPGVRRIDIKQRYYFKGSNTEPNFACDRFRQVDDTKDDEYNAKFLEAYNCCINRSKNMICLEYLNDYSAKFKHNQDAKYDGLTQPYISHHYENKKHKIKITDKSPGAREANDPERGKISFCEIGSSDCYLGDFVDVPVAYKAYQHPLRDKYVCARSYSLCPYNFTVGTGTAMSGTDINYKKSVNNSLIGKIVNLFNSFTGTDLEFNIDNRERHPDGFSDCQYMNHCSIMPGDKEDLEYSFRYDDGDGYFISSACTDGRGDSQNYNFNNNLLTKKLDLKSITAPLSQCIVETFENLLLNKYGSDSDDGSYSKGEVRNLPSFFDELQGNLQDILKILLICAVTLVGYKILLAGGIERKELMAFILKLAFVMYFVSGNAWKNIFNEAVISLATTISTVLVNIDGDDINIYPDEKEYESLKNFFHKDILSKNLECINMTESEKKYFGASDISKGGCNPQDNSRYPLIRFKNDPEKGYYFKKDNGIYNISNNNICQFPKYDAISGDNSVFNQNASYPEGKEYLKIFDTLDCMISHALGISVLSTGESFISAIVMSFFNGFLGFSFAIASLFFAISILSVAIKVLISFAICIIYIVMLIYISPITITCILFDRTKDVFNQWFSALISYSLQSIFTFIFVGFFISIFNDLIVKNDVRFEYQITSVDNNNQIIDRQDRVVFVNCNDWKFDENQNGSLEPDEINSPNMTSIYCFFNEIYNPNDDKSESVLSGLATFGMYFYRSAEVISGVVQGSVTQGQGNSKFINMLQIAVIAFILNYLMNMMPTILNVLISGMAFGGQATGGNKFSAGSLSGKATGYAKVGKGVIGGLGRRYGKKLSDRITKKSQDNPKPEFNIDAKDAAASNGESGGNRLSPKISSKPNGDENGGRF